MLLIEKPHCYTVSIIKYNKRKIVDLSIIAKLQSITNKINIRKNASIIYDN